MKLRFYICKHCGNIVAKIRDKGVPVMCCGEKMTEIVPGQIESATEKHIPVFTQDGNTLNVTVGAINHPMTAEHFIEWVFLQTNTGCHFQKLNPGDEPKVSFALAEGEKIEGIYSYCNLHGLNGKAF